MDAQRRDACVSRSAEEEEVAEPETARLAGAGVVAYQSLHHFGVETVYLAVLARVVSCHFNLPAYTPATTDSLTATTGPSTNPAPPASASAGSPTHSAASSNSSSSSSSYSCAAFAADPIQSPSAYRQHKRKTPSRPSAAVSPSRLSRVRAGRICWRSCVIRRMRRFGLGCARGRWRRGRM